MKEIEIRIKPTREHPLIDWRWFPMPMEGDRLDLLQLRPVRPSLGKSLCSRDGYTGIVKYCHSLQPFFSTCFSWKNLGCRKEKWGGTTEGCPSEERGNGWRRKDEDTVGGEVGGGEKGRNGTRRQFRVSEPAPSLESSII